MLLELEVRNLAVIEKINLSLSPGLNILTGETGAGKSILIDAIGLVLGERASTHYIRTGAEQARVTALFQIPDLPSIKEKLKGMGLQPEESRQLVLSRDLNASGKSTCRINGQLTTVSMLRSLAGLLVDIHGQHEHQSLLRPESHLTYLDNYGGTELNELCRLVQDYHSTYCSMRQRLATLDEEEENRAQKLDFYSFQASEIASAGLRLGEEEELTAKRDVLRHTEKLFQLSHGSYQALYGNESPGDSVLDRLGQAVEWLQQAAAIDGSLTSMAENLESISFQIEEIARDVRSYRDHLDLDIGSLAQVEERLHVISELKRKYGNSVREILQYKSWLEKEIECLRQRTETCLGLREKLKAIEKELAEYAYKLSKQRQAVAAKLEREVGTELVCLGMGKTVFTVSITHREDNKGVPVGAKQLAFGSKGIDQVEFLLAPNPGEEPKPLSRIASGGELSRIMLALKSILAEADTIPTLIFDEIDAGIGGRAAQAVAERLAKLGRERQVLCVTHLPQIATMADSHWRIHKEVAGGRTSTKLIPLQQPTERIDELARMLGGAKVTGTTKKHAQEMLKLANKFKETVGD